MYPEAEVRRATVSAAACWATPSPPNSPSLLPGVAQVLLNAGVCGDLSASVARPSVRDVTKISANEGEVGASRRLLPQLFNFLNNCVRLACRGGGRGGAGGQLPPPPKNSEEGRLAFWKRHEGLDNSVAFLEVTWHGRPCWTVKGAAADLNGAPLMGSQAAGALDIGAPC